MNSQFAHKSIYTALVALLFVMIFLGGLDSAWSDSALNASSVEPLNTEIAAIELECESISARVDATSKEIAIGQTELEKSELQYNKLQKRLTDRLNKVYRNNDFALLEVLLHLKDFEDLLLRISYLQRINQSDLALLAACERNRAALLSRNEELSRLKSEKINLKQTREQKILVLKRRLAAEQTWPDRVAQERKKEAARSRSTALGSPVKTSKCKVMPYPNHNYITAAKMPGAYQATGVSFGGIASWYGNQFHGRPTASGEIFNENDFTCASKTLPFGTFLRITHGNRHVVVKVNDRGPYVEGRVLDLSKAAARALGISGIGYVTAEIVKP